MTNSLGLLCHREGRGQTMPRDHAQMRLSIWGDDDFRSLSGNAQHLYWMLLMHPELSYCGVLDWRPARLSGFVGDWTVDVVREAAGILIDRLYIVVDESTEEVLVRSFVRHDGLMKMPKMATAMATAHAAVGSSALRQIVVWELQRLHQEEPEIPGWRSLTAAALLDKPSVDPSTYPCGNPCGAPGNPPTNPPGNPSVYPSRNPSANPSQDSGNPSVYPPVSPSSLLLAPTPSSVLLAPDGAEDDRPSLSVVPTTPKKSTRRKPMKPWPEDFTITERMKAWSDEQGFLAADVEKQTASMRGRCLATDRRYVDWVQAWQNWMTQDFENGKIRKRGQPDRPPRAEFEMKNR